MTRQRAAAAGAWMRFRAFSRRWPALLANAHRVAIGLLPLELLTGAALYFPHLHTSLIRWLPLILGIHVWAGVLFCVLLPLPLLVPLGKRLVATAEWVASFWFLAGLGFTGLALWTGLGSGSPLRVGAFGLHGVLSIAFLLWVLYHAVVRVETAVRGHDPGRQLERRQRTSRRQLLASMGQAVVGSVVGTAAFGWLSGTVSALGRQAPAPMGRTVAAAPAAPGGPPPIPGFQLYTVVEGYPTYDPSTYRLEVTGLVANPLSLSLDELLALPQVTETRDFHCVTGWVVRNVVWQGVALSTLLQQAQVQPRAAWITFDSFDGVYSDSLSLTQAVASGVILAHHADGRPLARQQGAPVRLFVPQMYGYKSVKWVRRLRLVTQEELGYWEMRGYGPNAYLGTVNGWPAGSLRSLFP